MSVIERSIQVGYQLRVYFTQAAFDPSNLVVKTVLCGAELNRPPKALIVLDESLAVAQPDLRERIAGEWRRCFEEWGYPVEPGSPERSAVAP